MSKSKELTIFYQIPDKRKKGQQFPVTNSYTYELKKNQHFKLLRKKIPNTKGSCGSIGLLACYHIYSIIRELKPNIIIETGIDRGVSSTYILLALKKNGKGKLVSIDKDVNVGQLIPDELKVFWEQLVGKTSEVLPTLNIRDIDIFLHDSLHTYDNMLFEYRWAYPRLKDGGLLLSHDIGTNNSFYDFAEEINKEVRYIMTAKGRYGVGIIVKGSKENKFKDLLTEELSNAWFP